MAAAAASLSSPPPQVRRWRGCAGLSLLLLLLLLASAAAHTLPTTQPARAHRHTSGVEGAGSRRTAFPDTAAPLPTSTQRHPPRPTSPAARGRGQGDIVFPDSQYKPRFSGRRPNCARGDSTFCESGVEGYPMVHLNQILGNSIGYQEYFGNDTLGQNLADRFGADGERAICPSEEKIIFPKMGQNADGQWVFIVNQDNNYQQGIRVELCKNNDSPCLLANALPGGTNAMCRQKYIYRRMVAVGDAGEAEPDSFKMPSCCACYINSEVTSRILTPNEPLTSKRRRRHNMLRRPKPLT